ncbi:MAG TPA: phage tail tape measure protein [Paraburkholderia sp.]|uniref:phage tail tape measure protein n=1 Tax=Paraburkholderia sp. TaxID=1926495 RepID=UPI002B46661C|nr:phage tail tape measure protein [Paraburkholderia sp.]HKR45545.1 phage tail tape measure protein [Paraburkholderia sp.]
MDLVANTAGFERGMTQAERALASATKEAKRQGDALDRLIGQIDPAVAAYSRLDKMEQQLEAHRKAGRLPTEDYARYKAQLDLTRASVESTGAALAKNAKQLDANGLTAKQLAANLRGVPAQFTDIAVSLQAGQNPLTVFLQQGGQLKDMFGGIGPAAKALGGYVLGLINPFTAAAAAAAVLALAYKQGSDETTAFTNALILNGNAAGTNADQLATQAQSVSQSVGTVGAAAKVLAQLAASGKIPADSFDTIAIAALKMQEATGKAAEETVKDFEKLAKDPVKAVKELNDSMNFLTTSTYAQIEALQRAGDTQAAANLAEQTYAEALTTRANKIVDNLGYVESAWLGVKNFAKDAWDAMLDVGRETTIEQKLKTLNTRLQEIANADAINNAPGSGFGATPSDDLRREQTEKEITDLLVQQEESRRRAASAANVVAQDKRGIAAVESLNKALDDSAPKTDKLAKRFVEIDKQVAAAAARGVQYSDAQIAQLRKAAEEQYKAAASPKAKAFREDAGQKMLDSLRQQAAALQVQTETTEKLGTQAQALARFEQQIADIKSKDQQTADQKSLLASEDLLRAQLKRNVALEQEIDARKRATEETAKLAAFQENQQSKLSQAQEGLNASLMGLGSGDKLRERLKEDLAIRKDYQDEVDKLNKQLNTGQISQDLYDQETAILEENLASRLVMQQDYYNQIDEAQSSFFLGASEGWANWADEASNYSAQAAEFVKGSLDSLSDGLADTFMSILDGTKSVGDAFADLGAMLVKEIVGALVKMAAQWIVYQGVVLLTGKATQASAAVTLVANAQATAFQASLAAFASTAAIPIVGPILAPAAAASAAAFAAPLVAGVSTAALAGMAHDGIDSIPETGTWLLQKGERVTTADTSAKLDRTLDQVQKGRTNSPTGGSTVNIIEDASKAGQTRTRLDDQGMQEITDVFVSQIYGDGELGQAMQGRFGLRGQGQ